MTISSRTPEGDPNQCPICGHHVRLEPSIDTRDAPCPSCGHLLWFAGNPSVIDRAEGKRVKVRIELKQYVVDYATKRFGRPPDEVRAECDKLDASKFEKADLEAVLRAKGWYELMEVVAAGDRK
jgi:DNA-directed RNA polymerase subunit RPC12/RpoP